MISLLLQFFAVGFLSLSNLVDAGTYTGYTTTATIPFLESSQSGPGFDQNVHVKMRFSSTASTPFQPFVDTGSCGIIMSAAELPDWDPAEATVANKGWQYLSSQKNLYNGYWVTRDVYFEVVVPPGVTYPSPFVKVTVPILAVTKRSKCPQYNVLSPGADCPVAATEVVNNPTGIRIMGIGFGREGDGQPQGTPDKNPLLNVKSLFGSGINGLHYWPGYIIKKEGITLGLTDTNTGLMKFTSLVAGGGTTPYWNLRTRWPQVSACITITEYGKVPGASCLGGNAVLDTGVADGFIRVQQGSIALPRDPNSSLLYNGTRVQVVFGSPTVGNEDFTVGLAIYPGVADQSRVPEPDSVTAVYDLNGRGTFINTSRYIYNRYNVAFDPVLGRLGFQIASDMSTHPVVPL